MIAAEVAVTVTDVWQDKRRGRYNDGEREWLFTVTAGDTGQLFKGELAWSRAEAEEARGELLARMDAAGWEVEHA